MTSFDGKVIALTGGASGIGRATAHLLAARGAAVSLVDVQEDALTATAHSIKDATPDAKVFTKVVNVTSSQEVDAWIQEVVTQFGKLDGAANLAGTTGKNTGSTLVENVDADDFDKIIAVNLKGVFNCVKAEVKVMKDQGNGSIVNASSVAGIRAYPMSIAYCASKHAVVGMTATTAGEYAHKNLRVNAIAPGPIDTPMMSGMVGSPGTTDSSNSIINHVPMKRYGTAEEVAKLVAFLLSEESTYCTGSVFTIDGGMRA
ncbi:MAG: hypothetical protein Q9166_001670 [cf. Caloplaca sp. 2 TL-2023]